MFFTQGRKDQIIYKMGNLSYENKPEIDVRTAVTENVIEVSSMIWLQRRLVQFLCYINGFNFQVTGKNIPFFSALIRSDPT